jgi:MFS family permease
MNGILRVPRSRGVLSGLLLVLLGAWGALVPFVGPYFHYAYTPDTGWTYTSGRFWLEVLPGAGAVLGGLIVLVSAYRPAAHLGAWLAAVSGAWFVLGGIVGPTWSGVHMSPGTPVGGTTMRALEQIGFFTGLGVLIVAMAAVALGRFSVISVRDAKRAERAVPAATGPATPPAGTRRKTKAPARAGGTSITLPSWLKPRTGKVTRSDKDAAASADTERIDSAAASR